MTGKVILPGSFNYETIIPTKKRHKEEAKLIIHRLSLHGHHHSCQKSLSNPHLQAVECLELKDLLTSDKQVFAFSHIVILV